MASHLLEWLGFLVRWSHLIAGVAWIGNSFYFVWLDNALTVPEPAKKGVEGDLWMVHSGGFYQVEKRKIGPGEMPKVLHWFKWEATFTWLTGFVLLLLVYHLHPETYLVDPGAVWKLTAGQASAVGIALPFAGWLIYDALWQSPLGREDTRSGTVVSVVLLVGLAYLLCHLLGGRAAYIHFAAVLGTIMVLNVWVRILPAQQQMIDATKEGRVPDFSLGKKAKRRSMHNSYVTLPVLILMISNHYPSTYGSPLNWLILLFLFVGGASVRLMMIRGPKPGPLAGAWAGFIGAIVLSGPGVAASPAAYSGGHVSFEKVRGIIGAKCITCHSPNPADRTFGPMPSGVNFEVPQMIPALAERIKVRVVETQTMPPGNKTGVTAEERAILGQWIKQGASTTD